MRAVKSALEKDGSRSALITAAVVLGLVFATGSVGAFSVSIDNLEENVQTGEVASFDLNVDLQEFAEQQDDQYVPVQHIKIQVAGEQAFFHPNGTKINGSEKITIESVSSTANFGYGYGYATRDDTSDTYSYGYGYGYGYGSSLGEATYSVNVDTDGLPAGQNNVVAKVKVGRQGDFQTFTTTSNINVNTPSSSSTGGGGGTIDIGGTTPVQADQPSQSQQGQGGQQQEQQQNQQDNQQQDGQQGQDTQRGQTDGGDTGDGDAGQQSQSQQQGPANPQGPTGPFTGGVSGIFRGIFNFLASLFSF